MQSSNDSNNRGRAWVRNVIVAYAFLFVGCLFNGVDSAFLILGVAIAIFFLALAWLSFPFQSTRPESRHKDRPRTEFREPQLVSFTSWLMALVRSWTERSSTPSKTGASRYLGAMFIGGMILFFVILFFAIGDNEEYSDVDYYVQSADQWFANSEYDSAWKYYHLALSLDNQSGDAYRGVGNIYQNAQQYDSAIMYFDRAVTINPEDEQSVYGKALSLFSKDEYRESLDLNLAMLGNNPGSIDATLLAADCYFFLTSYDSAAIYYKIGYDAGARFPLLMQRLALAYEKVGDYDLASDFYEESLDVDSSSIDVYERLLQIGPSERKDYYSRRLRKLRQEPNADL